MSAQLIGQSQGHGKTFPVWLQLDHPEARLGTLRLKSIDPELVVGYDVRRQVFQVWGPSAFARGWVPIFDVQDDAGVPFRGRVPWDLIRGALLDAREGDLAPDRAAAANAALERAEEAKQNEHILSAAEYFAKACAGEVEGWGRWDGREMDDAFAAANDGRSKAAPRERVVFAVKNGRVVQ